MFHWQINSAEISLLENEKGEIDEGKKPILI